MIYEDLGAFAALIMKNRGPSVKQRFWDKILQLAAVMAPCFITPQVVQLWQIGNRVWAGLKDQWAEIGNFFP